MKARPHLPLAALLAVGLLGGCLRGRGPAGADGNRADRERGFAPVQIAAGKAYLAAEHLNDAFVCFRRATQIDPKSYDAQLGLAQASAKLGATTVGLNAAEAASKLKPTEADPLVAAGQLSLGSQRPAEGEKYLRDAIRLNPKLAAAWRDLGEAKLMAKSLPESVSALERARELAPQDGEILGKLATVYAASGRYVEAIKQYRAAAKADPKTAVYPRNLAWLLIERGENLDEARAMAKKADGLERGDGDALVAAAVALLRQGNIEDAYNELRNDLTKVDTNGDLWVYFAEACAARAKAGDYENAVRALETVNALQLPHRRVSKAEVDKLVERIKAGLAQQRAGVQGG
jgi:tetratricopeptide (TPR) repeat protein